MTLHRTLTSLLLAVGIIIGVGYGLSAVPLQAGGGSQAAPLPKDVHPDTQNRLPPIKREDLDEQGKKIYDRFGPKGPQGPNIMRMYNPLFAEAINGSRATLTGKSGMDPRLAELVVLIAAREMDNQYIWSGHEVGGREEGLPQDVIDVVKFRKPVTGLGEKEATLIQLGREALQKHKVSPETYAHAINLFGMKGTVDLVALMALYTMTAVQFNTFDQHLEPNQKPTLPLP